MLHDFHFLTPEWFLALLPLALILWGAGRQRAGGDAWQRVVDPGLLPFLLQEGGGGRRRLPLVLVALGWTLAVLALANPTWQRLPTPAFRTDAARVLVLDLSASMEAADLKPSRLARARYKVADILRASGDGQVGLVAFAGDAFVVAPLSDDAETLLAMLDALSPQIMPVRGSRPDLGLTKAGELLAAVGARDGEVILVTDDPGDDRALTAAGSLANQGHRISVLGVGTSEGAPVPGAKDADGKPVISRLAEPGLEALARAGGGDYATLTPDGADLARILHTQVGRIDPRRSAEGTQPERWQGLGPLICLALLPLGAVAFRRGWLLGPLLGLTLSQGLLVPGSAEALTWNDLWQRPDQQAAAALNQGEPERALGLGPTPDQRGTASYRLKDYPSAAEAFGAVDTADGAYNRGNALAQAGRLEEALGAYDQALARAPGMEDALYNRAKVEELLRQQKQQEQKQDQAQSDDQSPQDQKDQGSEGQDQQGGEKDQQQAGGQEQKEPGEGEQSGGQDQQAQGQDQGSAGQDQQAAGEEQDKGAQGQQEGAEQAAQDSGQSQDASAQQGKEDKAAQDYRREAAQAGEAQEPADQVDKAAAEVDDLTPQEREAQQAADQWLRRIPDDPAGLLRRKFQYQYRQRAAQQGAVSSGNPW
jgi:Ca-activated chloride channel family protein